MITVDLEHLTEIHYISIGRIYNIFIGGHDGSYCDEILEFDPLTGQWKEVAKMMKERDFHGVSIIEFESGLCGRIDI